MPHFRVRHVGGQSVLWSGNCETAEIALQTALSLVGGAYKNQDLQQLRSNLAVESASAVQPLIDPLMPYGGVYFDPVTTYGATWRQ